MICSNFWDNTTQEVESIKKEVARDGKLRRTLSNWKYQSERMDESMFLRLFLCIILQHAAESCSKTLRV